MQLASGTSGPDPVVPPGSAALPGYHGSMDATLPFDGRPGPTDTLGRAMRDLRISVTDRCNFRCTYCMPKEVFGADYAFLPRDQVLSFEEIERAARIFVGLGVEKLRITGGEPLVRRNLPDLIAMLSALRRPDGGELDLTLTTNGSALRALAGPLGRGRAAARDGQPRFTRRRGVRGDERDRLPGRARPRWGRRRDRGGSRRRSRSTWSSGAASTNRASSRWRPGRADKGVILRFIEYMDVGHSNGWRLDEVVPAEELVATLAAVWPVEPVEAAYRARSPDAGDTPMAAASSASISSVTQPFCGDCTRARISAEGKLYTCLFAVDGHDLRALLRSGATDAELTDAIAGIWTRRGDRYSELRSAATSTLPKIEMFAMGG